MGKRTIRFTEEEIGYIVYILAKYMNIKDIRKVCRLIVAHVHDTESVQKE